MTKPLGIKTFKPNKVTYCISPKEFKELVDDYFKNIIKIDVETEVKIIPNDKQVIPDDHFIRQQLIGHLIFPNIKEIPNKHYHSLIAHEITEDTDPNHNFDILMGVLFFEPDYYEIYAGTDQDEFMIFIYCPFEDYIKHDGPSAQREAE